jgi:hypothetical protein
VTTQNASTQDAFRECVQIGVVVRDLDRTIDRLTGLFNIGPFRVTEWPPKGRDMERVYYGKPGDFTARMAFTSLGTVELELIQPVSGGSIWADFLEEHGDGIHHIRFNVLELDPLVEDMASKGIQVSQMGSGLRPGTVWANFASEDAVGFVIEVLKMIPGTNGRTPEFDSDDEAEPDGH